MINIKIKDINEELRPREKLIKYGVDKLSDIELLSIIIGNGTKYNSAIDISRKILEDNSINNIVDLDIKSLIKYDGIGLVKAINIISSIELGKRILTSNIEHISYRNASSIYNKVKYLFIGKKQELFYVLYFNSRNEIIDSKLLFIGTNNRSFVDPKEIFKYAYLLNANGFICIHNHPSLDVSPSREDIIVTNAINKLGELSCITLLDHIIVSDNSYFSFRENKML